MVTIQTILILITCTLPITTISAYAQTSDPEAAKSLKITEVELSDNNFKIWVEVHNPTNKTFSTPVEIRPLGEGFPDFLADSVTFNPYAYIVFEVWDNSRSLKYPNENATILLLTSAKETDRTPPLNDTSSDSRTWQLNGTKWTFVEQTPTRTIPEFSNLALQVLALPIAISIYLTIRKKKENGCS